jgi:hypothetical protein
MDADRPREGITTEARRMEENADYASQALFETASLWGFTHYALTVPAAVLSFLAGATALKSDQWQWLVVVCALMAGLLSTLVAVLKPHDRGRECTEAGNEYLAIRNEARFIRSVQIEILPPEEAAQQLHVLEQRRDANAKKAPVPGWLGLPYARAKRNIARGQTTNEVDRQRPS